MSPRVIAASAAVILALEAVVAAIVFAMSTPLLLPVTVDVNDGFTLTDVNLDVAVVVMLAFSAACRAAAALRPHPLIGLVEWSQVSAVTVFLIAQLNGVQDVAALVALYALTAAASLFLLLHQHSHAGRWPFAFGAAVGVVPWGVIAFYQIGAIVTGDDPAPIIRVMTVAMLASAVVYWWVAYHRRLGGRAPTLIVVVQLSVFAATIAAIRWTV
ncbi:hypothetical protein IWX81_002526 [Salinibacterium sp. CAN_S4]|uniref:hypothetical protein n=1 Tax=Salinibacterium sp. CAN_S4 TaxID=2787727 RepID=UPI0018EF5B79